jgi:hypothetical protein
MESQKSLALPFKKPKSFPKSHIKCPLYRLFYPRNRLFPACPRPKSILQNKVTPIFLRNQPDRFCWEASLDFWLWEVNLPAMPAHCLSFSNIPFVQRVFAHDANGPQECSSRGLLDLPDGICNFGLNLYVHSIHLHQIHSGI